MSEATSARISKQARDQLNNLANKNGVSQAEYLNNLIDYAYEQGLTMEKNVSWQADKGWNKNEN